MNLYMPLSHQLLQILACPDDKASVKYQKKGKKETLICTKCKRVFLITDGIPVMLPQSHK